MAVQAVLERYISFCSANLEKNSRALAFLKRNGISERFIFENFQIGYSSGNIEELIGGNDELAQRLANIGIIRNGKEVFKNRLIIPIFDDNKTPVNIAAYSIHPQSKNKLLFLNDSGIFNQSYLKNATEILLTENPLEALVLIAHDYPNVTFISGNDQKYAKFIRENGIKRVVFTFEGGARLFHELSNNGVATRRAVVEFEKHQAGNAKEYLQSLLADESTGGDDGGNGTVEEIENGFLFQFPHLNYRVLGNFSEYTVRLKANVKAYSGNEVFYDSLDLLKNRDRQNFIFNLMDRLNFRDQVQLEDDLNQILQMIEKRKEEKKKKQAGPELTESQKETGLQILESPHLIDEIEADYSRLGYVRESKNKILLYLVMTSRLMDNPLHSILISRSGAGKSFLAEITEQFCPPEDLQSVSDLSSQALYYFGQDDLKHKFVVIGEKEGSEGSDYPLRELISKKSITKALPMKDPVSSRIKTVSITVNGPISLVETTTNGEVNPENLNRCFVIGIDESEEQTRLIHELQRENYTLDGHLQKRTLDKTIEKHVFAQRLLRKMMVVNPFAKLLTFPASRLKTRRDHERFLRLINAICFLHQYQREVKSKKLAGDEVIEYIECTLQDYRIAYELLSDGVLDHTLDDLPSPTRKLLELIKKYLKEKSARDTIPVERIVFERREIREYTSWSFAQVRNNFQTLRNYEYLQLIRSTNGLANQYKLSGNYSDLDFLTTILSPGELEKRIREAKENQPDRAAHS